MATVTAEVPIKDRDNNDEDYRAPRQAEDSIFQVNLTISDFEILGRIGDGSFSTVILALHKATNKEYAVKIISKHLVMRNRMVDYIKNERNILDKLDYDGISKLHFTFQDSDSLYMGMEYCQGGELYGLIQKGKLSLSETRFYAAEIVDILQYLREKQVVHRDLKPENLLLNASGHLKIVDFGSAKAFFLPPDQVRTSKNRTTSFVGTADYVSPEVLTNTGVSFTADYWALGCLMFQMLVGKPPFKAGSEYLTFQRITAREFNFPDDMDPVAKDLIDRLLQLEPSDRIGVDDVEEIKTHEFFKGIVWKDLRSSPAPPIELQPRPTKAEVSMDWELRSLGMPVPANSTQ